MINNLKHCRHLCIDALMLKFNFSLANAVGTYVVIILMRLLYVSS